jgi:chromate reductase, NAD(P)H dehydrogenase (quinone)
MAEYRENPARPKVHLNRMRVLAISGSLRSQSTNTSLTRALQLLSGPDLELVVYEDLNQIPPFNPDLEATREFYAVNQFRRAVKDSDVVLFSTPEYAHGIPGVLKNALDWIVGTGELSEKPVVLVNASSRGVFAQAALREVLATMNATVLHEIETTVELPRRMMSPEEIAAEPQLHSAIERFFHRLAGAVKVNV